MEWHTAPVYRNTSFLRAADAYPYPDTLVVTDASVSDEDIVRRIMEQQLTYYTRMGLLYPDRIFDYEIVRIIPTTDATKPQEPLYSVVYSVKTIGNPLPGPPGTAVSAKTIGFATNR